MSAPTVFVVDDDDAVRDGVCLLCETAGLRAEGYDSAESFLAAYRPDRPGCLVLDVRMGAMSGPQLQGVLLAGGSRLPIIFVTAHGDIPMTVRAMKSGAMDFLTKPVQPADLLDRIHAALASDAAARAEQGLLADRRQRLLRLTSREREVLLLAAAGHPNKVIALRLGISHRTVEIHRSHIQHKTGAGNLLELAQLAAASEDAGDGGEPASRTGAALPGD